MTEAETDLRDLMDAVLAAPKAKRKAVLNQAIFPVSRLVVDRGLNLLDALDALIEVGGKLDLDDGQLQDLDIRLHQAVLSSPLPPTERKLLLERLSEAEAVPVEWLWHHRIPIGGVTIIAGDPGIGKGHVVIDLTVCATCGKPLACDVGGRDPFNVLYVSYEDDIASTLKPRADAVGRIGRNQEIFVLKSVEDRGRRWLFGAADIDLLEQALIDKPDIKLVVIDPIGSYVGGKINTGYDNQVRDVLEPLSLLAERYGIAVVVIMHLNKDQQKQVLYRVSGSLGGFVGVARSVLLVAQHPETEQLAVAQTKTNKNKKALPIEFALTETTLTAVDGRTIDIAKVTWIGENPDLKPEIMLAPKRAPKRPTLQQMVGEWLRKLLSEDELSPSYIKEQAVREGYAWATVRRAADDIGVDTGPVGSHGSKWRIRPLSNDEQ